MHRRLFNMSESMLNLAGEDVRGDEFSVLRRLDSKLRRLKNSVALKGGNFNDMTAKRL